MKRILLSFIILCLLTSCFLSAEIPPHNEEEFPYTPDVAWTVELSSEYVPYEYSTQDGNNMYTILSTKNYKTNSMTTQVMKIDITTGIPAWTTDMQRGIESSSPYKWKDYVFIHIFYEGPGVYKSQMLCFDDSTGELLATIRFGSTDQEENINDSWNGNITVADNGLYWGSSEKRDDGNGLLYFDPNLIDFNVPADTAQAILPELVYCTGYNGIWTQLTEDNGIIYFLTRNHYMTSPEPATLYAWDSNIRRLLWQQPIPCMEGGTTNPLLIHGDRIYVIDTSSACFDKNTGEQIFLRDMTKIDQRTTFTEGTGSYFVGPILYYEDKLYYTNHMASSTPSSSDIPINLVYNLVCVDAKDGHVVWKNRTPFSKGYSIFTNAIAKDKKVYFVTDCGLRVYDSDTGKLIGVDASVINNGFDRTIYYDGLMVFRDYKSNKSMLTAIRI